MTTSLIFIEKIYEDKNINFNKLISLIIYLTSKKRNLDFQKDRLTCFL